MGGSQTLGHPSDDLNEDRLDPINAEAAADLGELA
jgi:hypothetical protein